MNNLFQNAASHVGQGSPDLARSHFNRPQSVILSKTLRTGAIRVGTRGTWLLVEFVLAALAYPCQVTFRREGSHREARARWLQRTCRRLLRVFAIDCRISGAVPTQGLLASNHLSYLDILVLGALFPCVFVAKHEVRTWPVFGWFARLAGTVFIRREKRSEVVRASGEITKALNDGALVVLFPEGTSSGGDTVLPFKPALFSSVVHHPRSISCGCIDYSLDDGCMAEEVCYWRDMTLVPHLLNLLGKGGIAARLVFAPYVSKPETVLDRKELARQLHSQVRHLRHSFSRKP